MSLAIAQSFPSTFLPYGESLHRPFQCFMGRWEGLCKTFTPEGSFLESSAVHMDVYWKDETTWHLHEHFDNLYQYGEALFEADFTVNGKYAYAKNDQIEVHSSELTPYNYVFSIDSKVTNTMVYNNHFFLDPNTRRIITHKVRGGQTHIYQIQDFVRIVQP
ncbi:MAG TPA: hypothetical protein DIU15_10865 [Deltaproteobacteria bacterium]|nr:hypothetical protein [Deltaproteobacteria bacterium]HCP46538.1 hypothetical protein [Deltaproteobacteria bacterium]|tara:strand:- start:44 stop:526 length:483 start_codon:yes stop_codon:yes gene_type:complete